MTTPPYDHTDFQPSQPPGQRWGEGTKGLWNLIREDGLRKDARPPDPGRGDGDARRQANHD